MGEEKAEDEGKNPAVGEERTKKLEDSRSAMIHLLKDLDQTRKELEQSYEDLAVLERARALTSILFKDVLEPLLKECNPKTITKVGDVLKELSERVPLASSAMVAKDGSVSLDEASIRAALAGSSPSECTGEVADEFSEIMDECYPSIREEVGDQKITEIFSNLFKERKAGPYKPDLLKTLPEDVELPGLAYKPLAPGKCYLIEGSGPAQAFSMFEDMISYELPGLCISTTYPADLKREREFRGPVTVLWLSKTEQDHTITPSDLPGLRDRISAFTSRNRDAAVLLEGLEYLEETNGFDIMMKFLHDLREVATENRSRLILPIDPEAFEEKQLAHLERYMEVMEVVE